MSIHRQRVRTMALALSLGGLGAGVVGCASQQPKAQAVDQQAQAMKGGEQKCGKDAGGEKKCGTQSQAEKERASSEKGGHKGCGEGSCGS